MLPAKIIKTIKNEIKQNIQALTAPHDSEQNKYNTKHLFPI